MDDRLSSLSDDVLGHILSFLDIQSAVQTSVFSSRWKYLYTFATGLNIDSSLIQLSSHRNDINRVVMQHKGNIKKFTLSMPMYGIDDSLVNSWIAVAVSQGVEELKLYTNFIYNNFAPAGFFISQTLVVFNLSTIKTILGIPSSVWLPSLQILRLTGMQFSDSTSMTRLINGCPLLQDLSLYLCIWEGGQVYTISTPMLRCLRILTTCMDKSMATVEFDAPRLKCFKFFGLVRKLYCIKRSTALAIAEIKPLYCIKRSTALAIAEIKPIGFQRDSMFSLIRGLSNATAVKLILGTDRVPSDFVDDCSYDHRDCLPDLQLPIFGNLLHLKVSLGPRYSWTGLPEILQHLISTSPKLETLVFREGFRHCYCHLWEIVAAEPFTWSSQVKVIEVNNFSGSTKEVEMVTFFLTKAKGLKKLNVNVAVAEDKEYNYHCHTNVASDKDFDYSEILSD